MTDGILQAAFSSRKGRRGSSVCAFRALLILMAWFPFAAPVSAETLQDALILAYTGNPALAAERAKLRAIDETVPEALSGWRPSITAQAEGGVGKYDTDGQQANLLPRDIGINVTEPIYRGGRTVAATDQAEQNVYQERARLVAAEQSLLADTATAFLDVLSQQEIVTLNSSNEKLLSNEMQATDERYKLGELTHTDFSQSQSRLARAEADLSSAQGTLAVDRIAYSRLVGQQPGHLEKMNLAFTLPESQEATVARALKNNPLVIAADAGEKAAQANIEELRGALLPEISLQGTADKSWDEDFPFTAIASEQLVAQLKVPLYAGGAEYARLREAYQLKSQARMLLDDAKRQAEQQAVQAWEQLQTAEAEMKARQAQIRAADVARQGVREEAQAGTRTPLDTLDADQEYLDARIGGVQAERDRAVAVFQMLAATGDFTAEKLHLDVGYYDPAQHYNESRGRWFGTGASEAQN